MKLTCQVIGIVLYTIVYRLFLSPLANVPGPLINKLTRLPYLYHIHQGTTVQNEVALHATYGPVVQISPGDVSFTSIESAWSQIYGFRTGPLKGHQNHPKNGVWLGPANFGVDNVLRAHQENHGRQRKVLSHAFSERALSQQENMLHQYIDMMIEAFQKSSTTTGEYVNAVEYYNWTTFDIIGDLLFGKSFGNLEALRTHDYIRNVLKSTENFSTGYIRHYYPIAKWFGSLFINQANARGRDDYCKWIAEQTEKRMARKTERADFMTLILQHNGEKDQALSNTEINANASLLIVAGSETTATLMSGATWLLMKNPDVMQKLKEEVRTRFVKYEDITLNEVAKAPYLLAVLNEALRYYPPVPTGFPRVIAQGGEMVSGYYMPQNTSVCVSSFAAHHSSRNFADPERFDPERWLGAEKYATDKQHDIQPFSFGPHACLGKVYTAVERKLTIADYLQNLAYGEMRLMLAKVVWSFDLEMDSSCDDWLDRCRVFALWKKPALLIKATEVKR